MLKGNVIGLLGAATLGTVMLSPAMTLYGMFGPAFATTGAAAPLAFICALLVTIPTAISYALVSRDHPSSGSAYAWTIKAVSPAAGVWAGWMVFLYYLTNFVIQPVTFGLFFNDLLTASGLAAGFATFSLGVMLAAVIPAAIVYRGIAPSTKGALAFLLVEVVVVAALCLTIVLLKPVEGTQLSTAGFQFASASNGLPGLFKALVFAMLAFCGFDVISTLAEETKMPRKLVPQATLLSLVLYGGFVVAGIWCLTYAATPERLKALANSGGMPITALAKDFWGPWSVLIALTGVSATLGIGIATSVGASRILYSMGRNGHAAKKFATTHPVHHVPWNAMHIVFTFGIFGPILLAAFTSPYDAYIWFCTTTTFFAMVTYLLVNLANILLNTDKVFKSVTGVLLYGLIPAFGIVFDGYILFRSFFVELWSQGWATGKSVVVFDVGCAVLALAVTRRHWSGARVSGIGKYGLSPNSPGQ